jgi:hypothetical protein
MTIETKCATCGVELVCPNCSGLKERDTSQKNTIEDLTTSISKLKSIGRNPQREGIFEEQRLHQDIASHFPHLRIDFPRKSQPDDMTLYLPNGTAISIDSKKTNEWRNEVLAMAETHRKEVGAIYAVVVSNHLPKEPGLSPGLSDERGLCLNKATGVYVVKPREIISVLEMLIHLIGVRRPADGDESMRLAEMSVANYSQMGKIARDMMVLHQREFRRWSKFNNDMTINLSNAQGLLEDKDKKDDPEL